MTHVTILGAGIAGLSSGWLLKQQGIDFNIIEKQSYAGGLARSFNWHGFSCDFAAHRLFTSDENILNQLLNLVPMGRQVRRSRIYLRGHWMRDPLDIIELAQKLNMSERFAIMSSFAFRGRNLEESNFENFVLSKYGEKLYEYFFQPYTEKLFGIPGRDLSVNWARQKVRLANPFDHIRENTKTKFQYFYYPIHGGYGAIAARLFEEVKSNVVLEATVTGFGNENGRIASVKYLINDQAVDQKTDAVISTLPIPITTRLLGQPINFKFQKVDAVYLLINQPLISDYHWSYFIDANIAINRLVEFKNMSPVDTPEEYTVLCAEVTQNIPNPISQVIEDLDRIGLVDKSDILDSQMIHEEFAYPVYAIDYDQKLDEAKNLLLRHSNIHVVGRAAEFQHREVDDLFEAAANVISTIIKSIPDAIPVTKAETLKEEETGKIFAVVLAYNNYDDTQECLKSILNLNYKKLEIIVVDNGSKDGTPENIRLGFPNIHLIENSVNLGVPAGFNIGFRYALQAGADYILMLNNDTILAADMLDALLKVAHTDDQAGIIMPRILYHGSADKTWSSGGRYRSFPPAILMTDNRRKQLEHPIRLIEYAPSCGLLIHRRAFERAGLFDPGYFFYFDDWDFSERVRAHGLNIWFVNDAVLWHKVSRTTNGSQYGQYWRVTGASMTRFYRRHGRPVWFSIFAHVGYFCLREFIWKRNWKYFADFWTGFKEGLQKPLGTVPGI